MQSYNLLRSVYRAVFPLSIRKRLSKLGHRRSGAAKVARVPQPDTVQKLKEAVGKLAAANARSEAALKKGDREREVLRLGLEQLSHEFGLMNSKREVGTRDLTEQEKFWAGAQGTSYALSNYSAGPAKTSKLNVWGASLHDANGVETALELGCNIGLNLTAIHELKPEISLSAVEINPRAAQAVRSLGYVEVFEQSLLDFDQDRQWDLVLIRGVLMHLDPSMLPQAYDVIDKHAKRYVIINENFSEAPEVVPYKGRDDLLMSRHFAGELCTRHPRWRIIADGWDARNEKAPSNRDRRWFLMETAAAT